MKRGYKKSEIGEIPDEWEVKELGQITTLLKDGTHGSHKEVENGIPLLSAKDIQGGLIDIGNNPRLISMDDFMQIHKTFRLRNDDILLTIVGSIGRTAILSNYENNFTFQRSVAYIRLETDYLPHYYFYFFQGLLFQNQIRNKTTASAQGGIYLGELNNIKIICPPLPEQKKIAEILSSVDEAIRATQAVIDQTKKLKQGLLNQLLTKGIGHKKFKQTEIGEIPVEWEVRRFGDIVLFRNEKHNPISDTRNLPCIELENIEQVTGRIISAGMNDDKKSLKTKFYKGDILFGKLRPYLRKYALLQHDGICSTEIWALHPIAKDLDSEMLYYIVQSDSFIKEANKSSGSKMPRADAELISDFTILLPPLSEQKKIADILSTADENIRENTNNLEQHKATKSGLMQDLLTGKKRVSYAQP